MSDGADPSSLAIGASVTGAVGLLLAFVRSLFVRNVSAAEKTLEKMQADIASILLELRSMHDQQTNMRADITSLTEKYATLRDAVKAEHDRIDALVSPSPRGKK